MKKQQTLMKFDPATGKEKPYPSHAAQWRDWHGKATAWLFNPWTGDRRKAEDVGSDPFGHLILPPGELVYAGVEVTVTFKADTSEVLRVVEDNKRMRIALERIAKWEGEFPETGKVWSESQESMSFGACYGSNGERDFMRNLAREAIRS